MRSPAELLTESAVTKDAPYAGVSDYKYGFHDDMKPVFKAKRGLTREVVCQISEMKNVDGAKKSKSNVLCDALILDPQSRSDTYPYIEIDEDDVSVGHEASVSKIGDEQLFYLMNRGISEHEAMTMIVCGFIEPLVKELPMEYAVEMNKLIELQMEGTVG